MAYNGSRLYPKAPSHGPRPSRRMVTAIVLGALCVPQVSLALTCTPPSASHPTLQQAVNDPGCTTVELAAQAYPEQIEITRSLTLTGTGPLTSTVDGPMLVRGSLTQVAMASIGIRNGCAQPGLRVQSGALVTPVDVRVSTAAIDCPALPNLIFENGYE